MDDKERFIAIEQRGITNGNKIIEIEQHTKSNTHRITKLEKQVEDLKKETSVIGEVSAVLKMQSQINLTQTKHMEKLDQMLSAQTQNLTELNFITKQLQQTQDKIIEESDSNKLSMGQIGMKIALGLVAIIPSVILAWILYKAGLK